MKKTLRLKSILIIFGTCLFLNWSSAQRTVTGTVLDDKTNETLIGATVQSSDDIANGTTTDIDGKFRLEVSAETSSLIISYTGYGPKTVEITDGDMTILMSAGQIIEEVVVVGYGTQKTKEVTSAITSLSSKDFNQGNVTDPIQLLQGKVAGLAISRPGGNPNANVNIRLRGLSTFGGNTEPLIVLDGVIGASLQSVDPRDIETFDILKDASAAAIYGTRASSGVILITTKKGKKGTASVEYEGFVTTENVARKLDVLNREEYLSFKETNPSVRDFGSDTDWFDEITRTAVTTVNGVSLSGGSEKTTYRLSLNYRDGQGVGIATNYNQLNARVNLQQKALKDRLTLSSEISSTVRKEEKGFNNAFGTAATFNPTAPVRDTSALAQQWGGYFQGEIFGFFNPVAILEQNLNDEKKTRLLGSFRAQLDIFDGFYATAQYAQTRETEFRGQYISKESFWRFGSKGDDRGFASRGTEERVSDLFESTLNYQLETGKSEIKLLAGYSYQQNLKEGFGGSAGGFLSDDFTYNNLGAADDIKTGNGNVFSYKSRIRTIAFFGRVNYNYDDLFFLSASLRREGDSRFGANNAWGNFPGASAGVDLARLIKVKQVDRLKLRAGYGVTGNTPSDPLISVFRFGPTGQSFYNAGEYIQAYAPVSNPNPDLKWETKTEMNFGLDFAMFDYLFTGSIDYYRTKTKDLILNFQVPSPPNLFQSTFLNLVEMEGSGVELTLDYNGVQRENFSWKPSIAFTRYFDTKLLKISDDDVLSGSFRDLGGLGAPNFSGETMVRIEEGQPIGGIYGAQYLGLDENGEWIHADIDTIEGFNAVNDRTYIGNGLPKYQLGINNTFTYKNFDFNFFLRGVFGHDLVNTNRLYYESPANISELNGLASAQENRDATQFAIFSDRYVEDASFLRLDNATFGYNFNLPKDFYFTKIRLYISGQNLMTWTNYSGIDPEVRFIDDPDGDGFGDPLAPGIERRSTYLTTRSFTFGLNLGF